MIASIKGKSSRKAAGNISRLRRPVSHVFIFSQLSKKCLCTRSRGTILNVGFFHQSVSQIESSSLWSK